MSAEPPAIPLLPSGVFRERTALVTGGGTGLGLAVSTRLGQLGARVLCASREEEHHTILLERAQREGFEAHSYLLDVRDARGARHTVAEAVARFGAIDLLVNNAAGNFIRPSMLLAPKAFATVIDIALTGVFTMSREVGRAMRERGGAIVNISAPYASTGKPGVVHSACAKAGVEAMTRTLAAEWACHGIRVNAVSPGPFESEGAAARLWPSAELEQAVRAQIPLGRFGRAAEIAELVCFLGSPAASWITGSVFVADGGWSLPVPLLDPGDLGVRRRRPESDPVDGPAP